MSLAQAGILSGDIMSARCQSPPMQKGRTPLPEAVREIMRKTGERLTAIALMHEMGPTEMEKCLGLSHGHWRTISTGERPLALHTAIIVCNQFDVTLDWLFRGVPSSQVDPDILVNLVYARPDLTERKDMAASTGKVSRRGRASSVKAEAN